MTSTVNPHFLSQMDATPTLNLQDGTDYPHSGLFDMLHRGMRGCYAVLGHANDFNIAQSTSGGVTRLAIQGGSFMWNGELKTIASGGGGSATNLDLSTNNALTKYTTNGTSFAGTGQDITPVSSGDVYVMIVIADADGLSPAFQLRGRNADTNKVPMLIDTDIPIALVKMTASSADDATNRPIQYFTTSKTSSVATFAYENSSVFTMAGAILASSGGTIWQTIQDITINNQAGTTDLILQDDFNDAQTGPSISLKNLRQTPAGGGADTGGTINFVAYDNAGTPAEAAISRITSTLTVNTAGSEYGDLRFWAADYNGTLTEGISLLGQSTNPSATSSGSVTNGYKSVRVGIRNAVPLSTLDIGGSMSEKIRVITSDSEVAENDRHIIANDGGGAAITIDLPRLQTVGDGRIYTITNYGASPVTIDGYSSETITFPGGTGATFGLDPIKNLTLISYYNGGSSSTWYFGGYDL